MTPSNSPRRPSLRLALIAGALGCLSAGAAQAQDQAAQQPTEVGALIVTAPNYVPTTNTSATKLATPLVETPASISVITRDQIDVLNMTNLQQAVRYTAGALGETFGADSRYDWLTIRGFTPVEFIDGIQAPVGSVSTVGLDLWGAQSVEVLKGPAGVLYGATPPGGIVNYTSRRPLGHFEGEVQGLIGSFDNRQIAGDVTGPVIDGLSFRLTGLYRKSDTQIDGAHVERTYIAPALKWDLDEDTHLTLLSFYQRDDNHGGDGGFLPAQGTLLPNPNGAIPVSTNVGEPGYNLFKRDLYGVGYEASHRFNEHLELVQDLKYTRQKTNFLSIYGTGLQSDLRTLNRANFIFPEDIRNLGVDTRLQITADTGPISHEALIAVDYLNTKNHTAFEFGSAPSIDIFHPVYGQPIPAPFFVLPDYVKSRTEQTGVYAQDTMKLDDWRLTLNGREDHLSGAVDDNKFTWRAGVNYVTSFGLAPYVAYATSFQPVTGADFNGNAFVPTTGRQFEAGVKYEPRPITRNLRWFASAAAYDLVQQHVLTNDPAHLFFSVQTGEVEVKGVELESVARIRERLSLNASYSYTDAKVTRSNGANLGKQLPATPRSRASLLVDYTSQEGPLAGFGGGAGVRYLGASYGDSANTLKSPSETLVDLLLHYDLGGLREGLKGWRVSLNANNIFDKVYVQSCSDLNTCFYSQRRNVMLTLDRKW